MTEIKLEERIVHAGIASENVSDFLETVSEFYNDEGFRGDDLWDILCDNHPQLRETEQEDKDELLSLLAVNMEEKKVLGLFNVKHEVAITGEVDIHMLLNLFHKWLYFENDYDITIPVAFAVSNFTDTDPGCLGIIAPSGSYKTELIRAFGNEENEYVFPIDNLTPHTFVSGMKNVEDIIPQLTRRLILIKDFTTLLSKREDDRTAIFSDIRELLDGYLSRSYGSGKRVSYTDIHSSILLGSTGAIERYYSLNATLGQRIIFFKPKNNPTKARERAFENMNKTTEMRIKLHEAMMLFLDGVLKIQNRALNNVGGNIDADIIETLGRYADFVALARTHILKDFKGEIAAAPEPEFPTRLFKEIIKIVSVHSVLYKRTVTAQDIQAGITVLLSNIPTERFRLLEKLAEEEEGFESSTLASSLHLSRDVTRKRLDELLTLGIVDRILKGGRTGDIYQIKKDFLVIVRHLFNLDISLFVLRGNPYSSECERKLSLVSKLQLTNSNNINSNSNTNNVNKDKSVLTHIPHSGTPPITNNAKKEKNNTQQYGTPPITNNAKCEICAKVATLTSFNLDGKAIGICDNCRKELEDKKTESPINIVCVCGKRFDTIEVLQHHQANCRDFQAKQSKEARKRLKEEDLSDIDCDGDGCCEQQFRPSPNLDEDECSQCGDVLMCEWQIEEEGEWLPICQSCKLAIPEQER